jgi:hypothetical protein
MSNFLRDSGDAAGCWRNSINQCSGFLRSLRLVSCLHYVLTSNCGVAYQSWCGCVVSGARHRETVSWIPSWLDTIVRIIGGWCWQPQAEASNAFERRCQYPRRRSQRKWRLGISLPVRLRCFLFPESNFHFGFQIRSAHGEYLAVPLLDAGININVILPDNQLFLASLMSSKNSVNLVKAFLPRPDFETSKLVQILKRRSATETASLT